jgi:hypothetical protein
VRLVDIIPTFAAMFLRQSPSSKSCLDGSLSKDGFAGLLGLGLGLGLLVPPLALARVWSILILLTGLATEGEVSPVGNCGSGYYSLLSAAVSILSIGNQSLPV